MCLSAAPYSENDHGSMNLASNAKLQHALEVAGLEFLEENGAGIGVRFRKSRHYFVGLAEKAGLRPSASDIWHM